MTSLMEVCAWEKSAFKLNSLEALERYRDGKQTKVESMAMELLVKSLGLDTALAIMLGEGDVWLGIEPREEMRYYRGNK